MNNQRTISLEKEPPMLLNLSDANEKRKLMTHIGTLTGLYEVRLKPRKRTRSLDQNRYYFGCFVHPFRDWLRREYGDPSITTEQAHVTLKCTVLDRRTKVNEATGQALELVPTTHDLDTGEFSVYLDSAAKFLAEFCSIVVLEAEQYFESAA